MWEKKISILRRSFQMLREKNTYRKCGKTLTTDKSRQMEYNRPSLYYSNFFVILKLKKCRFAQAPVSSP